MPVIFSSADVDYERHKDLKKEDVAALMEWNRKQAHLPNLSEKDAIKFFESCYFKMEPTKICIENYFTVKTHNPEVFAIQKPNMIKESLDALCLAVLPTPTPEEYYIFFGKIVDPNVDKFILPQAIGCACMEVTLRLAQYGTAMGSLIVLDAEGFTLNHLLKINLLLAKKMLFFLQEALPVRLKGVHIFNAGSVIDKLFSMVKPFLGKELLEILHIHPKLDTLPIPRECLPNEYGGTVGTVRELQAQMRENIYENEAFFEEQLTLLVDETKRIGKSKYLDELGGGGMDGNFKKLDFD